MVLKQLNNFYLSFAVIGEFIGNKLTKTIKFVFLILTTSVSYVWSMFLLDIIIEILESFNLTMTYTDAGPIFGFGTILLPSLLAVLFFLPDLGTETFPDQEYNHLDLLSQGGVQRSRLSSSIRHDVKLYPLGSGPHGFSRKTRTPTLAMLIFLFIVIIPCAYFWMIGAIWFPSLETGVVLLIVIMLSISSIPIFVGTIIIQHRNFNKWREFWRRYWTTIRVMLSSDEFARTSLYSWDYTLFGSKYESLGHRLDNRLKYLDISRADIPPDLSEADALEIINTFFGLKRFIEDENEILQEPRVKECLKTHLDYIGQRKEVGQVSDIGEYTQTAAIILAGVRLAKLSIAALEDLMELDLDRLDRSEVITIARTNLIHINGLPTYLIPSSWQWLLISYSITTTLSIVLGPIFTQILLDLRPPT